MSALRMDMRQRAAVPFSRGLVARRVAYARFSEGIPDQPIYRINEQHRQKRNDRHEIIDNYLKYIPFAVLPTQYRVVG